ncbi:hypothetical protein SASPL_153280 [Salvia splendens]|uniref:Gag1-like clamp domain-containing protein n=1 Tax=Salvia splendens TaxID=180675 RepID=A0A8X8W4W5_SALSN|nr:hypothetical protein SASPL_153280 [Salvia splendens]
MWLCYLVFAKGKYGCMETNFRLPCNRGCLGCCTKPPLVISVDEPSKGLEIQGQRVKRHSLTEDFWSPSSGDMDNSGFPSHRSVSSMSTLNQTLDTNGLLLWNQTRQQWVGNKGPQKSGQEAQEAKLSFNTTYEGLLGSNKPFPQPIPLTVSFSILERKS